ncbi:MAG: copper resistance protein B [Woeseia sp.]
MSALLLAVRQRCSLAAMAATMLLAATLEQAAAAEEDERLLTWLQADRFEYHEDDGAVWDLQGWTGRDYGKLWWKTEGSRDESRTDSFELQLLYSRAISPYFDLQLGARHDLAPNPPRSYAVAGVQGLAPYWFEIDAAVFLSDAGDLSARIEVEYELLLTQRLILQPRAEFNFSAQEVPALDVERGLSSTAVGLRLRYELRPKFAPYVGVSWRNVRGGGAGQEFHTGGDGTSLVAGLRFWF